MGSTITGSGNGPLGFNRSGSRLGRSIFPGLWTAWGPRKCPVISPVVGCAASDGASGCLVLRDPPMPVLTGAGAAPPPFHGSPLGTACTSAVILASGQAGCTYIPPHYVGDIIQMLQSVYIRTIFQKAQTRQLWVGRNKDTEGLVLTLTPNGIKRPTTDQKTHLS